jgi:hypothetical protein
MKKTKTKIKVLKREGSHKETKLLQKTKVTVYTADLDIILTALNNYILDNINHEWAGSTVNDTDKYEVYKEMKQLHNRLIRANARLDGHDEAWIEEPALGVKAFIKEVSK